MPSKLEQSITDVPLGEMATRALTESMEFVPLYVKGLDAYTRFLRTMQTLDEEITIAIRQDSHLIFNVPG
jgi:hypothetical protein